MALPVGGTRAELSKLIQAGERAASTEVLTEKVFLGKPVYAKTLFFAAGPNGNTVTVAHGAGTLDQVLSIRGVLKAGTGASAVFRPLPHEGVDGSNTNFIQCQINGANIELTSLANFSASAGYVVIEFTR